MYVYCLLFSEYMVCKGYGILTPTHEQALKQEKLSARSIVCNTLVEKGFTFPVKPKTVLSSLQKTCPGTLPENMTRCTEQQSIFAI